MIKVSIIVPVYNVEKYLRRCLDSLVNQTLKDIEIIVVNDGSLDNSEDIILEYLKKYKNIKYYKKENGGLSDARNYGIKYAKGEYLAFVDSDDYVDYSMYSKMYEKAILDNFSIVACNVDMVLENGEYISSVKSGLEDNIDIKDSMIKVYPSAWNKIYKKELFNKVLFKKGIWFEDVEFLYRLYPYIKSIGIVEDELYHYVQREGAITKTFDERLFNYISNWNGIVDYYKKNNYYKDYYKEIEYCYIRYLYATFVKQALNYKDKKMFDKAVSEAILNVKRQFPKYRKNKYFYKSLKGIYLLIFNKYIANILYFIKR